MTNTQLRFLVQEVVDHTTAATIGRHVDRITESIVADILKERRAEFTALIDTAIKQALANLNAPPAAEESTP